MKSLAVAKAWAIEQALPLWSSAGFDERTRLFHERLDFERRPVAAANRRIMVQARQIATFSRASLAGWHDSGDGRLADCLAAATRLYYRADGAPGWIFSIGPDGRPASTVRDLYAHAFILYALGWNYRLTGDPAAIALADATLAEMDVVFGAPHGGYLDAVPAADAIRRQNPHMHLLEALLALAEATGAERFKARADALVDLAVTRFIDPATGALLEDFTVDWQPLEPKGGNRVEPGHLFEWAWLFAEYARLDGNIDPEVAERLIAFGERHGLDPVSGLVIDAVTDTGAPMITSNRSWPHAEGVKAFAAAALRGRPGARETADLLLRRMIGAYAPSTLAGGWIDRFDSEGNPLVDHMPASTLYHMTGAILEAELVFGSSASA